MVPLVCEGRPYHAIGLRCVGEWDGGEGGTEERKDGDKGREGRVMARMREEVEESKRVKESILTRTVKDLTSTVLNGGQGLRTNTSIHSARAPPIVWLLIRWLSI